MNEKIIDTIMFPKVASNLNSYRIIDADWKDSYGLVLVLKEDHQYRILLNHEHVFVPAIIMNFPIVRWINKDTFVIANVRTKLNKDNIFILNSSGTIFNSFHGGDAIEAMEVSKEGIWISYFEEGIYGRGISTEGLVLFSFTGQVLFRYHSDLEDAPRISECIGICKGKGSSIWLFPSTNLLFSPLIQVYPELRKINIFTGSHEIDGSQAICVRGKYFYFVEGYNSQGNIYCWEEGKTHPQLIGKINGMTRGLANRETNHFISISAESVTLHKIVNENEYNYYEKRRR